MPEIKPADLTLRDLVGLGSDAVTTRLPQHLLVEAARAWVRNEERNRRRQEARRVEARARGEQNDGIDRRAAQASAEAALTMVVDWSDVLDVKVQQGGEGQTWGTCTADDHEAAAVSLENSGAGYIRTAAMHRRAMADLAASGTRNLIESTMGLK
jgi:hypothetical protein